jgi:hypothetical protein
MSPEARERSFDELARGLASGSISRRKALRLMGAALVGGTLASLPGVAWAAPEGNSACDAFCHQNFSGRQAGTCSKKGARGTGPCYECTAAGCGPNFTKPTTCPVTGQTYNCSACQCECPSGQVVCGGKCGTSNGGTCTSSTQCCSGDCDGGVCCIQDGGQCVISRECCGKLSTCLGGICRSGD